MCVVVFETSEIVDDNRCTQPYGCYYMSAWRIETISKILKMKESIESGFIRFFVRGEDEEE